MQRIKRFGLIGYPLKNSFSADYFTAKFKSLGLNDHVFENFPLADIRDLPALLERHPDLLGLTVTIPHKVAVMKYLDQLDPDAENADAVNCVKIERNEKGDVRMLTGYNTDVYGFEKSLTPLLGHFSGRALILGSGGAAKAVAFVLNKLGIGFSLVSRHPAEAKKTVFHNMSPHDVYDYTGIGKQVMETHSLIINCTPAGMFPAEDTQPDIPYQFITPGHIGFDLIYLPEETLFLKHFRESGAATRNGLQMLHLQADKAWEIFSGVSGN